MKKSGMALLAMALSSPVYAEVVSSSSTETEPASEAAVPAASNTEALEALTLVASDPEALDAVPAEGTLAGAGGELQLALASGAAFYSVPAAVAVGVDRESDDPTAAADENESQTAWPVVGSSLESPWDAWENRDGLRGEWESLDPGDR